MTGALTPLIIRTNPDFLKVQRKLALLSKRQQQFLKLLRFFQKSLSERISNDPVIKEKLLSAEWITQEENLLLKVLPEYKEDILLFIAASGIKNITIC